MLLRRTTMLAAGCIALAAMLAMPEGAWAQRIRLEARLVGTAASPLASGRARFELRSDRIRFTTQVEDTVAGTPLAVVLTRGNQSVVVGTVTTNILGQADLNLDSRLGHRVPIMQRGDIVRVLAPNGVVLLAGGF